MKSTGMVKKLDKLHRLKLEKWLRRALGIGFLASFEIFVENDGIVLLEYKDRCYICDNESSLRLFKEKYICNNCIEWIVNL